MGPVASVPLRIIVELQRRQRQEWAPEDQRGVQWVEGLCPSCLAAIRALWAP